MATDKQVKQYMRRLQKLVERAYDALSGVSYERMPDIYEDTEVETAVADLECLRHVLRRFAESLTA